MEMQWTAQRAKSLPPATRRRADFLVACRDIPARQKSGKVDQRDRGDRSRDPMPRIYESSMRILFN